MKSIQFVKSLDLSAETAALKPRQAAEIFSGSRRRIIEINLREGAALPPHKAPEPITVLCLAGRGIFRAGPDLEDEQELTAGTLVTLEADVLHEVLARPSLNLLVTKFKEA
jgi:quercetin dioxygenase-like cupin family protein